MPEKQQIIKTSLPVSCETYNCYKKVQWAIGRPDGPRELWDYYCDSCIRDIVASIPEELLPGQGVSIEAKREQIMAITAEIMDTQDDDFQAAFIEELLTKLGIELDDGEPDNDPDIPNEVYICGFCGKECKNKAGLQAHERMCKVKEE
jgi:hypothetical protein